MVYTDIGNEFLEHLEAKTDKNVHFFPVQNNAVQIEAMRSGRSHIVGFLFKLMITRSWWGGHKDYDAAALVNSALYLTSLILTLTFTFDSV